MSKRNGRNLPAQPAANDGARQVLTHLSAIVDRMRFARRAGFQYEGKRDVFDVAGYPHDPSFKDYWARYVRQDIAGRIVDMPAAATWRRAPEVVSAGAKPETDPFAKEFGTFARRLRLWNRLERVDRLSRIGRYGALLVGVRGDATDQDLANEMPSLNSADDVLYLSAFSEEHAKITDLVSDPRDERYGLPLTYDVDLSTNLTGATRSGRTLKVHWSRVIHVAEDPLEDEVFGRPALERVLNRLIDLQKVAASTGEAYWLLADRILQGKIDPTVQVNQNTIDEMGEELEEIMHDLRRHFMGQGVELGWVGSETPDPTGPADFYMALIAAAAEIPKRILFGTETGERASDQDERQWLGAISERSVTHAEPVVLRPLIDRLMQRGAFRKLEYEVHWPNRHEPTEEQVADRNLKTAQTAMALTPVGGDPLDLVEVDEERNVWLRPTGERGEVDPEDIKPEPPEPMPAPAPGAPPPQPGDEE